MSILSMRKADGFSLIESAVVILFVSLAMVPIVSSMGGVNDNEATLYSGNVSSITAHRSKLTYAAQSIMERAMAGEIDQTTAGVGFDPQVLFPDGDSTVIGDVKDVSKRSFHASTGRDYSQPITFKWVVRDLSHRVDKDGRLIGWDNGRVSQSNAEQVAPSGNRVISAALELYENPTDTVPIMTLPTYYYRSTCTSSACGGATLEKTGISVVLDVSGSMWATQRRYPDLVQASRIGSPYLRNRYDIEGNRVDRRIRLNDVFDDTTLDVTYARPFGSEDVDTPFSEEYMQPGANSSTSALDFPASCADSVNNPANERRYFASGALNNRRIFDRRTRRFRITNPGAEAIGKFCGQNPDGSPTRDNVRNWTRMINENMSRIEGARNAILSMLVTLEENQFLTTYMKMGLVTFTTSESGSATLRVPLESAQVPPGPSTVTEAKFVNMRYKAAMINRDGRNEITAGGGTPMLNGLRVAATDLYGDSEVSSRLIIAIGDGSVNSGSTGSRRPPPRCSGNVADFAQEVGDGTYSNRGTDANGEKITIFSVGVIGYHEPTMRCLAEQTPNGQFFAIDSVADMQPIFDQIAFQIERLVLNSMVARYNLPIRG